MAIDHREQWIDGQLTALAERSLRRELHPLPHAGPRLTIDGRRMLNFCSNDYLGLANHPDVVAAAVQTTRQYGAGSTASRLVSGTLDIHEELETRLARYKGYPACLVYGSGFLTNIGVLDALLGRDDCVVADRLVHASVIDAIHLSGATLKRFRHNDADDLARLLRARPPKGRCLVVTESVFSMDGDVAPLAAIAAAAVEQGAMLMVDEAHSCGVWQPAAGLVSAINLSMGTLSKALGGYGGFVACTSAMRAWLINRSRSFIYTTAPPPASMGAALGALNVVEAAPEMGAALLDNARRFRLVLHENGLNTGASASQIVPVMVGDNAKALSLAARLRRRGVHCVAIRPPTVPPGTARLRLSVSLGHSPEELQEAADAIVEAAKSEGLL